MTDRIVTIKQSGDMVRIRIGDERSGTNTALTTNEAFELANDLIKPALAALPEVHRARASDKEGER